MYLPVPAFDLDAVAIFGYNIKAFDLLRRASFDL
jgi:hypothetical protein